MSSLYIMRYLGQTGLGVGTMYVGKGMILGADTGNGRYSGTYTESNGRLQGTVTLSATGDGAELVTGQRLPAGQSIPLQIDWPTNFADGNAQTVSVAGHPVQVTFEKLGDIP